MKQNWNWYKDEQDSASWDSPAKSWGERSAAPDKDSRSGSGSGAGSLSKLPGASFSFSPSSYFETLGKFYQDIEKMFEQTFRNLGLPSAFANANNPLQNAWQGALQGKGVFTPHVDISSTEKEYIIEVEAPGMNENDIRIDLLPDNKLSICGEKRLQNENQEKDFYRVERAYGSFSRTLSLPENVDEENIKASFTNGILTINAQRQNHASSQPKRIEVKSGNSAQDGAQTSGKQQARQDNVRSESSGSVASSSAKRVA